MISDTNLAGEGDFTDRLSGGTYCDFAGTADTPWQANGGVDDASAPRLLVHAARPVNPHWVADPVATLVGQPGALAADEILCLILRTPR